MTEDLDWFPPELAERARIAEERDILTAERLAEGTGGKQKRKPLGAPEASNPRFAFIISGFCLLFFLAAHAALYWKEPPVGLLEKSLNWASAAFSALIFLKFMLPVLKKRHKLILGILLAGKLLSSSASELITALAEADQAKKASSLAAVAFGLLISPMFWLLYGILRRQSSEKRAGLVQLAKLVMLLITLLIGGIGWIVNRINGKPFNSDFFSLFQLFNLFHGAGLVLLLMNWPVLERSAFWEKAQKKEEPTPTEEEPAQE